MEPLREADPARIAGYRLFRRLGAGGMGVVYLARSGGGSLAAVKVIRAASGRSGRAATSSRSAVCWRTR
ncbi:hypothetical protein CP983_00740 [Streptomyces chartreusis]|nr:hypothetical protein CP983_00740 [Streptomyces chartreusis]